MIRLIHRLILTYRPQTRSSNFNYTSRHTRMERWRNKSGCLRSSNITDFALSAPPPPSPPFFSTDAYLFEQMYISLLIFDVWLRSRKVIKYSFFLRYVYATIRRGEKKKLLLYPVWNRAPFISPFFFPLGKWKKQTMRIKGEKERERNRGRDFIDQMHFHEIQRSLYVSNSRNVSILRNDKFIG